MYNRNFRKKKRNGREKRNVTVNILLYIDLSKKILLSKKITFISILINVDMNRTINIVHRNDI